MSHVPHELAEEFPDRTETLHRLKQADGHAARLMEKYHDLNRQVHRAETDIAPVSDAEMQRLRKERVALKDQIARVLREADAG